MVWFQSHFQVFIFRYIFTLRCILKFVTDPLPQWFTSELVNWKIETLQNSISKKPNNKKQIPQKKFGRLGTFEIHKLLVSIQFSWHGFFFRSHWNKNSCIKFSGLSECKCLFSRAQVWKSVTWLVCTLYFVNYAQAVLQWSQILRSCYLPISIVKRTLWSCVCTTHSSGIGDIFNCDFCMFLLLTLCVVSSI